MAAKIICSLELKILMPMYHNILATMFYHKTNYFLFLHMRWLVSTEKYPEKLNGLGGQIIISFFKKWKPPNLIPRCEYCLTWSSIGMYSSFVALMDTV